MPRPVVHSTELMLDAARDLVLERGAAGATIDAIAEISGAPVGSIYHRFGSRDGIIVQLWMRAVYRSQASFIAASEVPDARTAVVDAGLSIIEFCESHRNDAKLLVSYRYDDLVRNAPDDRVAEELRVINRPIKAVVADLAMRLCGSDDPETVDRVVLATFDLPYGAVRRYLIADLPFPSDLHVRLGRAILAVIDD